MGGTTNGHVTYLSLGAGVQSTALLIMTALGLRGCPRASHAIFADTGDEPSWVYEQIEWCKTFAAEHGIDLRIVQKGHLSKNIEKVADGKATRFGSIPCFTPESDGPGEAMLRRQCTREYKIEPIEKEVRRILGLQPRQRAKGKVTATGLVGISVDEIIRMKPARMPWITHAFPLVDANMTRADCRTLLAEYGVTASRSSCVFCPYHSDAFWLSLKEEHPEEFAKAVRVDRLVRNMTAAGVERPAYLHRSLTPLEDVDFLRWRNKKGQTSLFDRDGFGNECEGMCGV
jgi:hypothetical protein